MKSLVVFILSLGLSHPSLGALYARDLDGNLENGHEGVYDDVLDITWLADANLAESNQFGLVLSNDPFDESPGTVGSTGRMTWDNSILWLENMNAASYLGYSTWRLPTLLDTNSAGCDFAFEGTDCGFNVQNHDPGNGTTYSELAHMYFNNLGGVSKFDAQGNENQADEYGISNANDPNGYLVLFSGIQNSIYWTGLEYPATEVPNTAWYFLIFQGSQDFGFKDGNNYAWAVHDGDIGTANTAVPIPAAVWLFGSGLLGLLGFRKFNKEV